jgi:hypothetical protein
MKIPISTFRFIEIICREKRFALHFIEDKSIKYNDQAKVKWWLSLGIYVKSNGTLEGKNR